MKQRAFKELAHAIVGPGKMNICRAGRFRVRADVAVLSPKSARQGCRLQT
jgi:hypothetical protein